MLTANARLQKTVPGLSIPALFLTAGTSESAQAILGQWNANGTGAAKFQGTSAGTSSTEQRSKRILLNQVTLRFFATAAIVVVVLAGSLIPSAQADILYSSPMTAPPLTAGDLVGQDGWAAHSGGGSNAIQVGGTGTTLDSTAGGTREDAYVGFTEIAAGQTYYFGFDIAVTGVTGVAPTNIYFAAFKDAATIGGAYTTRTFVTQSAGADFTFGLSPGGSTPAATWATGLTYGETYRVVGSYSFDNLETRLWVDPVSEASTSLSALNSSATPVAAFAFRQGTANTSQLISNLVVGTSFNDVVTVTPNVVTPVPEPSGVLGLVGLIAGSALLRHRKALN